MNELIEAKLAEIAALRAEILDRGRRLAIARKALLEIAPFALAVERWAETHPKSPDNAIVAERRGGIALTVGHMRAVIRALEESA